MQQSKGLKGSSGAKDDSDDSDADEMSGSAWLSLPQVMARATGPPEDANPSHRPAPLPISLRTLQCHHYATAIAQLEQTAIGSVRELMKREERERKELEKMRARIENEVDEVVWQNLRQKYSLARAQQIRLALAHFTNIQMFLHAKSLEVYAQLHDDLRRRVKVGEQMVAMYQSKDGGND